MSCGTTFHFVTEGSGAVLERAREAADGRDVRIGGGPATIRQYLRAGFGDELHLAIAPVVLGSGAPLFGGLDLVALGYRCEVWEPSAAVTHVVIQRGGTGGDNRRYTRGMAPSVHAALDACLDRLAARREVHHVFMAVRSGDGALEWRGVRGDVRPGGPPLTSETPFFVASVDKLVTATALFVLAERGAVDLDDRLSAHLDASLVRRLHVLGGVDRSEELTLRHVVSHTSGLADYLEDRPKGGRSLIEEALAQGDVGWSLEQALERVRGRLRPHFVPQDPNDPRARAQYSDTNYLLLKAVLEAVTGRPVAEAYRELVFAPLGMSSTFVISRDAPERDRVAGTASLWAGARTLDAPVALQSTFAMFSTLDDQLALVRGVVEGRPFAGGRAVFDRMAAPFRRFGQGFDAAARRRPGWPIEYAHGVMRFELPRWLAPRHRAPAVVGHTGSTGSWAFHCAELDLDLVGTVDQVSAGAVPFRSVGSWLAAARR
jgi:D-alanyl-D-alanine carboxypeptidase